MRTLKGVASIHYDFQFDLKLFIFRSLIYEDLLPWKGIDWLQLAVQIRRYWNEVIMLINLSHDFANKRPVFVLPAINGTDNIDIGSAGRGLNQ